MFALSASTVKVSAVAGLSARAATRSARRGVSLRVRAEGETTTTTTTEEAAPVEASTEEVAAPAAFKAAIDPADGSIAEAAPLGDDMSMFTDAMVAFKEPRAIEIINGRAAMIGWMVALSNEITNDQSLFRQVINTRTFTLADGVVKSSTFPATGAFLVPVVVLATLAASLAPVLRGNEESGLEKAPKDFFMFKAESEMTNGRGAMIGLVALLFAEKFTNGAALF
ncbi:carotene biosynthesis related or early light induced-like protein, chloroplast percursor [Micromonas pusilla CCMP1545]|jgi:hypothetical protein|uniref:Carotene biosynthesis related or early light induced-like protein, chloroplast percursor n=1 Tax=Micromonas pusilla (strain CCMP1545) TaxID=564608 RepID=C1MWA1_MICPC|nr:carotene biosynthesis related or early light induced-like protein, chloroplast percursor [Micromonas pusilla CCMP1545]EEH56132.1 carotene biosynthesis related or early light induced-like protein, chloroplast percursor [Micromonas pusilla CCMP1545]|eukprot:XP_003060180.1 carotene biosynthesis related or early light induced-like protein, chloroplast percursor [Micromonas pusilla CCMP1545]